MVVSFLSTRKKRLPRVRRFPKGWGCCLISLLALCLVGCAGKHPKAPPAITKPGLEEAPTTPADQRLREAIRYYMGTDYKYGGDSKEGLDCSGFVMKAYEKAGVKLPRTSELQFQHGQKVTVHDLRYGDLVFFNNYCYSKFSYATASILSGAFESNNQPCHVGIYIGDGRFIHSTASQGGVTVSNINADCWKRSLIGIRRYLPH
jgi:cell wall-associated NlpC family hydrolase